MEGRSRVGWVACYCRVVGTRGSGSEVLAGSGQLIILAARQRALWVNPLSMLGGEVGPVLRVARVARVGGVGAGMVGQSTAGHLHPLGVGGVEGGIGRVASKGLHAL